MGIEYKIKFDVPSKYDPSRLLKKLPSPIESISMAEIYSWAIDPDGFYFVDHLVNKGIASQALRIFIDEALSTSQAIEISEP